MTTGRNSDRDHPGDEARLELPAFPPVIFGIPMIIGALVHIYLWKGSIIGGVTGQIVGLVLIISGVWFIYWTFKVMRTHGEHPEPGRSTRTLITSGPFARTRNPIYSGFLLIGAGIASLSNALALLIAVFVGVAVIQVLVVRKEEAYLERKFGEVYLEYARKTRRWL